MDCIPEEQWSSWRRKRRHTTIAFFIIGTAEGMDNSVVTSTLYLYLNNLVPTSSPVLYYSFIIAGFYLFSLIFGLLCGRWLDRTRRVRLYVNVMLVVEIFGFLLYSIPYHPLFLLVGRCICGVSEPFVPVVTGEVIRMYGNEESAQVLFFVASAFAVGFAVGPVLTFMFQRVNFRIGSFEVNYLNFIGLFMAVLLFLPCMVLSLATMEPSYWGWFAITR